MTRPWRSGTAPTASEPHVSVRTLFLTFSCITLSGFGGMPFWTRRTLVERQRWLTEREFVELLALGQLLPGPGTLNLAVLVGQRFAGGLGVLAAVAGLLGWPAVLVLALGMLYQRYGALPAFHQALTGSWGSRSWRSGALRRSSPRCIAMWSRPISGSRARSLQMPMP